MWQFTIQLGVFLECSHVTVYNTTGVILGAVRNNDKLINTCSVICQANKALKKVCSEDGHHFQDNDSDFLVNNQPIPSMYYDHIHLNRAGNRCSRLAKNSTSPNHGTHCLNVTPSNVTCQSNLFPQVNTNFSSITNYKSTFFYISMLSILCKASQLYMYQFIVWQVVPVLNLKVWHLLQILNPKFWCHIV